MKIKRLLKVVLPLFVSFVPACNLPISNSSNASESSSNDVMLDYLRFTPMGDGTCYVGYDSLRPSLEEFSIPSNSPELSVVL
jgi:hypothetical protein